MNELHKYEEPADEHEAFRGGPEGDLGDAFGAMLADLQRQKLRNWLVRTSIGAVLFGYLASQYSWARWILYIWVPFAILSLLAIVFLPKILQSKIKSMFAGGMQPGQNPFGAAFGMPNGPPFGEAGTAGPGGPGGAFGGGFGPAIDVEAETIDVESSRVVPLREQLKALGRCGVSLGEGRTIDDVLALHSLDAFEEAPYELALVALGRELDGEPRGRHLAANAYSLDDECIHGDGSYVKIVRGLARITGEPERVSDVKDFIDPDDQRAELRYAVDGEPKEFAPTYKDAWVDAQAVEHVMRQLVRPGHGFYGHETEETRIVLYLSKNNAERMDEFIEDGLDPIALGA